MVWVKLINELMNLTHVNFSPLKTHEHFNQYIKEPTSKVGKHEDKGKFLSIGLLIAEIIKTQYQQAIEKSINSPL
jgi:hypothetical protein